MKFIVTQQLINKGRRGSFAVYERCPIALAIRQKGFPDAQVFNHFVEIGDRRFDLPFKAQRFIQKFDANIEKVKPFEFCLAISKPKRVDKRARV